MNYKIDKNAGVIACKQVEDFSFEQLFEHLQSLLSDPEFYLGINGLYDFTEVEHVTGMLQPLLETAKTMEDPSIISEPGRVAIIVRDKQHSLYKIFEGYCLMASNSLVKYKLFTKESYFEALEYLDLEAVPSFN